MGGNDRARYGIGGFREKDAGGGHAGLQTCVNVFSNAARSAATAEAD